MHSNSEIVQAFRKSLLRSWANLTYSKMMDVRLDKGAVSFTFNGAPGSAFTNGGNLLTEYGLSGTFYICMSLLSSGENGNKNGFTMEHLQTALLLNHELGSHTFSHSDFSSRSTSECITDMQNNQEYIQSLIPGLKFHNFSYPYGAVNRGSKRFIAHIYRSARGVQAGINAGPTDRYNLKAMRLYEKHVSLEQVRRYIDQTYHNKGWLIFYTHDVGDRFSEIGCSPTYLKSVIEACISRGFFVGSIDQVLDLIKAGKTELKLSGA